MNTCDAFALTATPAVPEIPQVALERCPLCDSPITRKQFVEIESRIRQQEQRKLEEQRRSLKEAQNKAKSEADARVLAITQERDAAVARAKNAQEQAREQTKQAVADAVTAERETMAKDYEKKDLARAAEEARKIEAANKAKSEADARVLTITQERDAALAQSKNAQEQAREQTKQAVADAVTAEREAMAKDYEKKDLARAAEEARKIEAANKAKAEADARVLTITQERDAALAQSKNAQEQAREQTKQAVADAVTAEREAMAKDYEKKDLARAAEEARKLEAANKAKAEADARVLTITQERDAAVAQSKNVQEQTKQAVADAVSAAREAIARDSEKKDLARVAEEARRLEAAQKTIDHLQRQLANKTANELGDDAEIDLFEMLRDTFTDDRITRVQKGERGADIKHEVRYKGVTAGVVLFDSKNRKAWQGMFASKLKEDQIASNADHAILSTTAFPAGKKELCVECDVIIARPGRVRDLVQILRVEIIKAHVAGLTNQKRAEKREALYQFISSETYRQKTAEVTRLSDEILEVDVNEKEQHDRTWKKRGSLVRQLQRAQTSMDTEISAILEGKSA